MALAEASRQQTVFGNKRVVIARLTGVGNAATYDTGLSNIDYVSVTPETATAGQAVGCTFSEGTITFAVEGGTPTVNIMAVGS
jgi:hypothetical protein